MAERLAELVAALADMRAAALEGALVDLAGLDGAIEDVLAATRAAPASEQAGLLTQLAQLVSELDGLAATLKRQRHAGSQRRAEAAYRGSPPPPPASNDNS
jgi:hypothetical protein